jgi:hypothetical protein
MTDWFDNDELFEAELRRGHRWAEHVASAIRSRGLAVEVTPMELRADIDDRHRFEDEHDLMVGSRRPVRIDVKSRGIKFTSVADYPYPTAFVDTASGWNAKVHKPVAIVLVSQITSGMLVVPRSTESTWRIRELRDRFRKIDDVFLEVRTEHLRPFDDLVECLRLNEAEPGGA